jgi:hypothetical protein
VALARQKLPLTVVNASTSRDRAVRISCQIFNALTTIRNLWPRSGKHPVSGPVHHDGAARAYVRPPIPRVFWSPCSTGRHAIVSGSMVWPRRGGARWDRDGRLSSVRLFVTGQRFVCGRQSGRTTGGGQALGTTEKHCPFPATTFRSHFSKCSYAAGGTGPF